jgi:hypothetical protein
MDELHQVSGCHDWKHSRHARGRVVSEAATASRRLTVARLTRRLRTLSVGAAAFAIAASGAVVAVQAVTPPPAHIDNTVGLKEVGPIDEANGFPLWYKDTNNVKLELCLDPADSNCIMGEVPDPAKPVSFPDNFPDEAFWSSAESSIDAGGGDSALLVTAVEAAFGSADGLPATGQQISFGRIRIRAGGLVDNAEYKITHPYGVDTAVAEVGAVKGVNTTEDIGSLTPDGIFDQTLGSRPAPFLRWDPAVAPAAPAGYLGDVTQDHRVVGSPYGTNFFRIEGPAGSFTGSTQLCTDPALGDDPVRLDDCIQSDDFAVHGKLATRMGVQATNAYYSTSGTGHLMDLFAKSEPGQNIVVKGTGVSQTRMREDAKVPGRYFARVFADGAPPSDLSVTNVTDAPDTVDHIELSMFGDKVHIASAVYSNDTRTLNVSAQSGDSAAVLELDGFPSATGTVDSAGVTNWSVPTLAVPPSEVMVTSDKGGVDTEDVVITGAEDPAVGVVAAITADQDTVQIGQTVTLDGLATTGTVIGYDWSVSPAGAAIFPVATDGSSVTFRASAAGTYTVELTVTGKSNTSTDQYTIEVLSGAAEPVANAGPDQLGVVPTSTVTLDGTASKFAQTYSWAQAGGDAHQVSLRNPTSANPTFVVPPSSTPLTFNFTLTIRDVNGTTATDTVKVVSDPGAVGVDSAFYKRGDLQWRVRGTAKYCSPNNVISVYWNKPVTGGTTPVLVGTTSPGAALGVCSWEFRVKRVVAALRPTSAGTITVKSGFGGEAANVPFDFL